MKRLWLIVLTLVVLFIGAPKNASSNPVKLIPTGFKTNGDLIMHWYWLRRSGHYAEWHFKLPQNKKIIAACFSTLSTNGINGGAGYNSSLKIITISNNRVIAKGRLLLRNAHPCLRRVFRGYSHGVGYRSYGCKLIKVPPTATDLVIKVEYMGRHHTAVNKDSLILYVK
ncbi:hypothetical protein [Hippea alviniae]|uniref:hypothetical protein n=1 Tax=Hippea alviniae TaxID=1279027 RepID=UPI0003B34D3E|nr:hypothetical protein [Hippea alviniae]